MVGRLYNIRCENPPDNSYKYTKYIKIEKQIQKY